MNSVGADTKPTKQLNFELSAQHLVAVSFFASSDGTCQSDFLSKRH